MSRVDEALKRALLPETHGATVAPPRSLEAVSDSPVLDRYVPESSPSPIASGRVTNSPAQRADELPAPAVFAPRAVRNRQFRFDEALAGKLVVSDTAPPSSLVQYRRLAGALGHLNVERGVKTLLVTSALPSDGRTLTVVNLALTLSESFRRRVLLIDADQRRPSIHTVFSVPNTCGLSDVLRSGRDDVPLVQVSENLSVLPAGRPDLKSTEALTSDRMEGLLEQLAAQVEWVLLDAAPVEFMRDAQLLARIAGAVLFVIGAGSTPYRVVARAIAQLGPECVVGTVLNRVAPTNGVLCVAR
jgi:capsular exopolysaccharide synthesis family protein